MNTKVISIILAIVMVILIAFLGVQMHTAQELRTAREQIAAEKENLEKQIIDLNKNAETLSAQNTNYQSDIRNLTEETGRMSAEINEAQGSLDATMKSLDTVQYYLQMIETTYGMQSEVLPATAVQGEQENEEDIKSSSLSAAATDVANEVELLIHQMQMLSEAAENQKENVVKQEETVQSLTEELATSKSMLEKEELAGAQKEEKIRTLNTKVSELEAQLTMMRTTIEEWLVPTAEMNNE